MRIPIWRTLGRIISACIAVVFGCSGLLGSEGQLRILNQVPSGSNYATVNHVSGASESTDGFDDGTLLPEVSGNAYVYSNVSGSYYWVDSRPDNSTSTINLDLLYSGNAGASISNSLKFSFPFDPLFVFGSDPIFYQQADSSYIGFGPIYDVRDLIANNAGILSLPDVPAGSHDLNTPYAFGNIYFAEQNGNAVTPEPSTLILAALGLVPLIWFAIRRRARRPG